MPCVIGLTRCVADGLARSIRVRVRSGSVVRGAVSVILKHDRHVELEALIICEKNAISMQMCDTHD